jgi:hypothetical protein
MFWPPCRSSHACVDTYLAMWRWFPGWPDWPNFGRSGDCFLTANFAVVGHIFGQRFFRRKIDVRISFDKHGLSYVFGRFFSQNHPVTPLASFFILSSSWIVLLPSSLLPIEIVELERVCLH